MSERIFAVVGIIILVMGILTGVYIHVYGGQAVQVIQSYPSGNEQKDAELNGRATDTLIRAAKFKSDKAAAEVLDANGFSKLHWAAAKGHIAMLKLLIAEKAEIDAKSPNGTTPLMLAATAGQLDAVKILIKSNADLTVQDSAGHQAAYYAEQNDHKDVADLLHGKGGDSTETAE